MKKKKPDQCQKCALLEHDAYICARWRLAYALNELKKITPLVRWSAAPDMRCPNFYDGATGTWKGEAYGD